MNFIVNGEEYHIDEMSISDIPQLVRVEQQAHSYPWSEQHFQSSIESNHHCHILRCNNECVAYCITSTAADEAELLNIAVAPAFQRRGIARAMLEFIFISFDETINTLFLEVRVSNQAAISLYHSLDFNEVGQRQNYYPSVSGREDALIMARCL